METYSAARIPHRKVFTTLNDALLDIRKFIKFSNVSISVWKYRSLEQKYSGVGLERRPTRMGPKYSDAIVDNLFFDIDCMDDEGRWLDDRLIQVIRLWDWARDHNYKRSVAFTGGGYQMVVATKMIAENYSFVMKEVAGELDIEIEEAISLTDMCRVVGSYNHGADNKAVRNKFCVSLTEEELHQPYYKHLIKASKQDSEIHRYGTGYYKPNKKKRTVFKKKELDIRTDFTVKSSCEDILDEYGYSYVDICPSMRNIIEQNHVSHMQRVMVIKYLKDIVGLTFADCVLILPKILTAPHGNETDGEHSVNEKQPDTVYSKGLIFMPDKMIEEGYCTAGCTLCTDYMQSIYKLRKKGIL